MAKNRLTNKFLISLFKSIASLQDLAILDLDLSSIEVVSPKLFIEDFCIALHALKSKLSSLALKLENNHTLNADSIKTLSSTLSSCKSLSELDISYKGNENAHINFLIDSMIQLPSIKVL